MFHNCKFLSKIILRDILLFIVSAMDKNKQVSSCPVLRLASAHATLGTGMLWSPSQNDVFDVIGSRLRQEAF